MTTSEADIRSYNSQSGSSDLNHDGFEELAVQDLSWAVNTSARYASMLHKIPDIFAWEESRDHLANLQILARSVALRRLRSCLDHIGRYDQSLFKSMRTAFEELPLEGKLRFMTAPETFYRITRLRKEPVDSIISLCNFLNGEAALHGLGPIDKDYVTALGDFYYSEATPGRLTATDGKEDNAPVNAFYAPRLAEAIAIDFASPNAATAQETDDEREYVQYSEDEKALVCEKLNNLFSRIERVSEAAAYLIKQHIKVIIPLKTAESGGSGSTSQPRYPGRVLLRGVDVGSFGALASGLVHEAMHQVLYILEWGGPFIVEDPDVRAARAKSEWTGRDLPLHSFIHACFIWYGLSNFWARARFSDAFDAADVERQLARSLIGFRDQNPVERLAPYAGMARYDVLKIAGTLRDRLQSVISESRVENQKVESTC
jgi:hypothetical protein